MDWRKSKLEIRAWIDCNLRLLAVKLCLLALKPAPDKLRLLRILGYTRGTVAMYKHRRLWPGIADFARHIGSPEPPRVFRKKYFVAQSQNRLFGALYYEAESDLKKYISLEDFALSTSGIEGQGVLFLGAHYGPQITAFILANLGLDIKAVFGRDWRPFAGRTFSYGLPGLKRKRWRFVAETLQPFVAGRNEKQVLAHLKAGGAMAMLVDLPRRAAGGISAELFGIEMRFNGFAFRLAVKYGLPVVFYIVRPTKRGYVLRFKRAVFNSPEEGLLDYLAFFQEHIIEDPYAWEAVPTFSGWLPPGQARSPSERLVALKT